MQYWLYVIVCTKSMFHNKFSLKEATNRDKNKISRVNIKN